MRQIRDTVIFEHQSRFQLPLGPRNFLFVDADDSLIDSRQYGLFEIRERNAVSGGKRQRIKKRM